MREEEVVFPGAGVIAAMNSGLLGELLTALN